MLVKAAKMKSVYLKSTMYLVCLAFISCDFLVCPLAFADEKNTHKEIAMKQLESAFVMTTGDFSTESVPKAGGWPLGLDVTVNNKWQFGFKNKSPVVISRISITTDDITIATDANLVVKANTPAYYFFANTQQMVQSISAGYNFLGIYQRISADSLGDFRDYRYKKVRITITWTDNKKNYNQATDNFMLVFAK